MDRFRELNKQEEAEMSAYAEFAETEWDRAYRNAEMALQRVPNEAEVEAELLRLFAQLRANAEEIEHE